MMHAALDNRPFSPGMESLRSQQEPYRSLPGTPLGIDRRALATMDIVPALNHCRSLLQEDYFSGGPRYPPTMRPRSPYPAMAEIDQDGRYLTAGTHGEMSPERLAERVCRTNHSAILGNNQIPGSAQFAKVIPHMCEDGRYPSDFQTPKTVQAMRVLDNTQLDRILLAYGLQTDHNALRRYGSSEMTHSSTRVRNIRLHTLWESLGAYKLVDYDKMKKGMI